MVDFAAVVAHLADNEYIANAAASDFNGARGMIDLTSPQSFVDEANKIVLNTGSQFDLRATLVYGIASILKEYSIANVSGLTEETWVLIVRTAGRRYAQHELLAMVARSTVSGNAFVPKYRNNDVIRAGTLDELFVGESPYFAVSKGDCERLADVIDRLVHEQKLTSIGQDALYTTVTAVVNAFHRHHASGHNFLTASLADRNTMTSRCPSFMGSDKVQFAVFLRNHGHDLWHFLTTDCLNEMALIMVGSTDGVIHNGVRYNGNDVGGLNVADVLSLPESVTDRYPPGTIGLSSILLGLEELAAMFAEIMLRSNITESHKIAPACAALRSAIGAEEIDRDHLLELRGIFGPIISVALGFRSSTRAGRENIDQHRSYQQFMANHASDFSTGRIIADAVAALDVDPRAAQSAIKALATRFSTAIEAYNLAADSDAAVPPGCVLNTAAIDVKIMSTKEVGKRREANLEAAAKIADSNFNEEQLDYY